MSVRQFIYYWLRCGICNHPYRVPLEIRKDHESWCIPNCPECGNVTHQMLTVPRQDDVAPV